MRTAPGSRWAHTGGAGALWESPSSGALIAQGNGFGPIAGGTGKLPNLGVGLAIITAIGSSIRLMAGFGCRESSGHRPGSRGESGAVMWDGLLCRRRDSSLLPTRNPRSLSLLT